MTSPALNSDQSGVEPAPSTDLARAFVDFLSSADFPCVGAKSALALDKLIIREARALDDARDDLEIRDWIESFGEGLDPDSADVGSLAILFHAPQDLSEPDFEKAMWDRLQCLHNLDVAAGIAWREDVDRDPEDAHFSMCIAGRPYFVVGLHPFASRPARRFSHPVLVFNSHDQFEALRAQGRFEIMKNVIRARERALAGSINPMLDDFGRSSEARQYSGRRHGADWRCPFEAKD